MKKQSIWKKTLGFILVGILIAVTFTFTDVYSLFQKAQDGYGNVIAASGEDIISNMEIYYDKDVPILILEKGDKIDYSPIVFFSIEGDAKDYALHVNSIKVDGVVETPLIPNVNFPQALALILSSKDEITGVLKVKHLNEFIDDTLEFSFSKDYLLSRYFYNKGLKTYNVDYLSKSEKDELVNLVEETLLYAKQYLEWEAVEWEEENNWISKVDVSNDQELLVDIIAPGLLGYNKKLYELLEIITKDLEDEIEKNNLLSKENEELYKSLEGAREDLKNEVERNNVLYSENKQLVNTNESLRDEIDGLYSHIYHLELEIEELMDMIKAGSTLESEKSEELKTPEILEKPEAL